MTDGMNRSSYVGVSWGGNRRASVVPERHAQEAAAFAWKYYLLTACVNCAGRMRGRHRRGVARTGGQIPRHRQGKIANGSCCRWALDGRGVLAAATKRLVVRRMVCCRRGAGALEQRRDEKDKTGRAAPWRGDSAAAGGGGGIAAKLGRRIACLSRGRTINAELGKSGRVYGEAGANERGRGVFCSWSCLIIRLAEEKSADYRIFGLALWCWHLRVPYRHQTSDLVTFRQRQAWQAGGVCMAA